MSPDAGGVRLWKHPNLWSWMSYRFADDFTEYVALPAAQHTELVALLGHLRSEVDWETSQRDMETLARLDAALAALAGRGGGPQGRDEGRG